MRALALIVVFVASCTEAPETSARHERPPDGLTSDEPMGDGIGDTHGTNPGCGEVTAEGRCAGTRYEWCADGYRHIRECRVLGLTCGALDVGFGCVEDTCSEDDFPMPNADLVEEAGGDGCPAGTARVEGFCINRYEAFLVDADGVSWSPFHNPGDQAMRARSAAGAVPQGHINQLQASAACAAAGKRLCTRDEWMRACQGPSEWTYPYGDARDQGRCNDHRDVHPVIELFDTTASWIWSELNHPCINQQASTLAPAGSFTGCVSAEGAFDLVGNLHEWIDEDAGTFKGGFYVDTVLNGPGCLYTTTAHDVSHYDYSTGFRCCAEPSTE